MGVELIEVARAFEQKRVPHEAIEDEDGDENEHIDIPQVGIDVIDAFNVLAIVLGGLRRTTARQRGVELDDHHEVGEVLERAQVLIYPVSERVRYCNNNSTLGMGST